MTFLSSILTSIFSRKTPVPPTISISLVALQKYFQLHNPDYYQTLENPRKGLFSIRITGELLNALNCPEHIDFQQESNVFEYIGGYYNSVGGTIHYGQYKKPKSDGCKPDEFLFVTIIEEESNHVYRQQKITPHFLFLGQILSHEKGISLRPLVLGGKTHIDSDGSANFTLADCSNIEQVTKTLAYADMPLQFILCDSRIPSENIATAISKAHPVVLFQKFNFLSQSRDPQSFKNDLAFLESQLIPNIPFPENKVQP